jgi:hypothetical protein
MPLTVLKHLAKKAKIPLDRAEHLWDKAEEIISSEYDYDKNDTRHWALRMAITKRMMGLKEGLRFSEFLRESKPVYEPKPLDETLDLIRQKASDFVPFLKDAKFIWRGISGQSPKADLLATGAVVSDPTLTSRKSISAGNFYNMLLDANPKRAHFPKRSASFIATTCPKIASGYGSTAKGEDIVVIPFNGVKMGAVNNDDMWQTRINLFGTHRNIEHFNHLFEALKLKQALESFQEFDRLLKDRNKLAVKLFMSVFNDAPTECLDHFLDHIWEAYSAETTEHTVFTTANMPSSLFDLHCTTELWIGGPVILVTKSVAHFISEKLKNEI